jgi:hypothetical protein
MGTTYIQSQPSRSSAGASNTALTFARAPGNSTLVGSVSISKSVYNDSVVLSTFKSEHDV